MPIRQNFLYPNITERHYKFGSNEVSGVVINPTGDWRPFLPKEELQVKNGIEASYCYIEAQQHTLATIFEKQYGEADDDFSARFNAALSDGTESGGDPLAGGDSIRNDGLIPDALLPFSDDIKSWEELHSFKGSSQPLCEAEGKKFIKKWKLNYDIVFERTDNLAFKYSRLKEALKYSPVPMSVYGLVGYDGQYLPKPEGARDTHFVEVTYVDENNRIYIRDTYMPFDKVLPENYNPDFALRWTIFRKDKTFKKNWIRTVLSFIIKLKCHQEYI